VKYTALEANLNREQHKIPLSARVVRAKTCAHWLLGYRYGLGKERVFFFFLSLAVNVQKSFQGLSLFRSVSTVVCA
jgi:hypothetical protein